VSADVGSTIASTSEPWSYRSGHQHHLKSWGSLAETGCRCSPPLVGCSGSLNYFNYCPRYYFLAINSEVVLNIEIIEVPEVIKFTSMHCSKCFCSNPSQPIHVIHLVYFSCFGRC
jgi:hypothetical protein